MRKVNGDSTEESQQNARDTHFFQSSENFIQHELFTLKNRKQKSCGESWKRERKIVGSSSLFPPAPRMISCWTSWSSMSTCFKLSWHSRIMRSVAELVRLSLSRHSCRECLQFSHFERSFFLCFSQHSPVVVRESFSFLLVTVDHQTHRWEAAVSNFFCPYISCPLNSVQTNTTLFPACKKSIVCH